MSPSLNTVLFGPTGVGKSLVINLIAGRKIAETSPDVRGCTMSFKPYNFQVAGRIYRIWETVGLEEPETGSNAYLPALERAHELIHHLSMHGGVDLLLLCIRPGMGFKFATVQSNHRLFYEVLCRSQVPIAFVITHLEQESDMEQWWERNVVNLEKYGIKAAGHACITGLAALTKYRESRESIALLLEGYNGDRKFNMPPEQWLIEFLRMFGLFAPLRGGKRKDVVEVLTKHCGLELKMAEDLASMPPHSSSLVSLVPRVRESAIDQLSSSPPRVMPHTSLNIVLFGETGVGKSSLINLIAGRTIAAMSPDVQGCTMSFEAYTFHLQGQDFVIWDTVGLEEPEVGVNGYLPAIEQACELIYHIIGKGGLDLLLFCIRGSRVTATTQSNYRLFYEVFCRSKVPIAAVVTHLEKEPDSDMGAWWKRNVESITERYGMKFAGHACVTGLQNHPRYQEAKRSIEGLLGRFDGQTPFTMPAEKWFVEFLRFFGLFAPLPEGAARKDVINCLMKRCGLDPKIAEELADTLQDHSSSSSKSHKIQLLEIENLTDKIVRTSRDTVIGSTWQYTMDQGHKDGHIRHTVAVRFVIGLNKHKKYRVDLKLRASLFDRTIVPLFGVVDKPMSGIVTRWYENGSLSKYLEQHLPSLPLEDKKAMLGDIAVGLRYLHNQNVVHGNLHGNNILIDNDGKCCLTDMCFTLPDKFIGASWLQVGSYNNESIRFADPKLVKCAQNAPDQVLSPSRYCDIYSFGGVMLYVLFGIKPYESLGRLEILEKLLCEERPKIPSRQDQVPPIYESLIMECWHDTDSRRPSAKYFITQNLFSYR